jgi:ribosomal protein L11 methyltransferase
MPLWEISIAVDAEHADALGAALLDAGAGGFEERADALVVWAESRESLAMLEAVARHFSDRVEISELDDSWRHAWARHAGPVRVSDGFVLQPIDDDTPAPEGTRRIRYAPELAFGEGSHPTTRLAARAVERRCRARPGASVLDVGTGMGVLAFVAVLSGARDVLGIDVDPVAVSAARENARLNELGARTHFETKPLAEIAERYELVLANLEAPVQLELAAELARHVAPGGVLVATGFLLERRNEIVAALGLAPAFEDGEDGWCLLELRRPDPAAGDSGR